MDTMTDLLSRPSRASSPRQPARHGGPASPPGGSALRPLGVSAAVAGAVAALGPLLTCLGIAVLGWFLADAGAHGQTTDALRVGADGWLVAHGSGLSVAGVPLGVVPLGLTALVALVVHRCGRWAGEASAPVEDDTSVLLGAASLSGVYVIVVAVAAVLAGTETASPGLGRAILGGLVVSGLAGTLGLARGTGRLAAWTARVPAAVRTAAATALTAGLVLLAFSALVTAVALALGVGRAGTTMSRLGLSGGDAAMLTLVTLAFVPNLVLLGSAWLLGPGFAVGTGTLVSPTAVVLGPLPALPAVAALPGAGPVPGWWAAAMALPVLAGVVAAVMVQRRHRVDAWDLVLLRAMLSGLLGGVLTVLMVSVAGGRLGDGRLAEVGASAGSVFLAAAGALTLGCVLGAVGTSLLQRRAERRALLEPAPAPEPEPEQEAAVENEGRDTSSGDTIDEETAEVDRGALAALRARLGRLPRPRRSPPEAPDEAPDEAPEDTPPDGGVVPAEDQPRPCEDGSPGR